MSVHGYFGIGVVSAKSPENAAGLWRSAHAFGATFIYTVGARYPRGKVAADTSQAWKSVPLVEYDEWNDAVLPRDAELVAVEFGHEGTANIVSFAHPTRAVYLLGAEDTGIPEAILETADEIINIPTRFCLNVATAGSIVMYDRIAKEMR